MSRGRRKRVCVEATLWVEGLLLPFSTFVRCFYFYFIFLDFFIFTLWTKPPPARDVCFVLFLVKRFISVLTAMPTMVCV